MGTEFNSELAKIAAGARLKRRMNLLDLQELICRLEGLECGLGSGDGVLKLGRILTSRF